MPIQRDLFQHTPIIHFQPHQKGATLRATDLKHAMNEILGREIKYKLRIEKTVEGENKPPNKALFYFGDIKQKSVNKKGVVSEISHVKEKMALSGQNPRVYVDAFYNDELEKELLQTLEIALVLNNFGTRNTKGAGGYFIKDKSREYFEEVLKKHVKSKYNCPIYYWDWTNCSEIEEALNSIKIFYSLLKTGITAKSNKRGYRTDYTSLLYKYFLAKGITWERDKIKKSWRIGHNTRTEIPGDHSDNHKFVRALFGTGTFNKWMRDVGINDELTVNIKFPTDVERIPSPIIFKLFNEIEKKKMVRIYFWWDSSYKTILGKEFKFSAKDKIDIPIEIPTDFDIENFIDYAIVELKRINVRDKKIDEKIKECELELKGIDRNDYEKKKELTKCISSLKNVKRTDEVIIKLIDVGVNKYEAK